MNLSGKIQALGAKVKYGRNGVGREQLAGFEFWLWIEIVEQVENFVSLVRGVTDDRLSGRQRVLWVGARRRRGHVEKTAARIGPQPRNARCQNAG